MLCNQQHKHSQEVQFRVKQKATPAVNVWAQVKEATRPEMLT